MTHDDKRTVTLDVCIFLSILWPLTIPLYIYGFSKWHEFRHHFLISKRFPKITYFLGVAAILEHLLISSVFWLHYCNVYNSVTYFLVSCCEAFMFAALSIVLYRIFLVYLTWRQLQNTLNLVVDKNNKAKPNTTIKPYHHKLSYCFITFILIGTITIMFKEFIYVKINRVPWTFIIIFGIILGLFLRIQKVKEGIGLLLESRIIVADVIVLLILLQFEGYNKVLSHCGHYLQIFSILLWCLMPLYLTLYYIYKFEGTLIYRDYKDVKCIKKTPLPENAKTNKIIPDNKSIEHVLDMMAKTQKKIENNDTMSVQMKDLNQSFEVFLENYENYKLFAGYLGHCFAIENLLFLERVCIFNVIINELNENQKEIYSSDDEMDMQISNEINNNNSMPSGNDAAILPTTNASANDHATAVLPATNPIQLINALSLSSSASNSLRSRSENFKKIPKLKFEFLTNIYDEYNKIINGNKQDNNVGNFLYCKDGIDKIVNKICNQFVINDAVNMVNIAYNTRIKITELIKDKKYFKNYNNYLHLFDEASAEILQLNTSLYNYRFRSYVDQNILYKD